MRGLEGKVAIITGAAKGIGRACAVRLAQEGAKVVAVTDRDMEGLAKTKQMIEDQGGDVLSLKVDVSKEEETLRMAEETIARFGRIDILVNNAAVFYGLEDIPLEEITVEMWDKQMAVQPKGSWLCARAVVPQMKKQGKGKILNITSNLALLGRPGIMQYVTSKGAVISMTYSMALELGEYNICVNSVGPGSTLSEATLLKRSVEEAEKLARARQCIKRIIYPEHIAAAVAFLASDDADMITAQTILVDGGMAKH